MAGLRATQTVALVVGHGNAMRVTQSAALIPGAGAALRVSQNVALVPVERGTQRCPEDPPGHPVARLQFRYDDWIKGAHDLAVAIQQIMRGETNNSGCFCLTDNSDTTTVQDRRVGPHGANPSACARGANEFVVNHANNANIRCFDYVIEDDMIFLTPINSGAAEEIGLGTIWIEDG